MRAWLAANSSGRAWAVLERGFRTWRGAMWLIIFTGFFEQLFYLLAMGFGVGVTVGEGLPGPY